MLVEDGEIDYRTKAACHLGNHEDAAVEPWGRRSIFYCSFGEKSGDFYVQGSAPLGTW